MSYIDVLRGDQATLVKLRNQADYDLTALAVFASNSSTQQALVITDNALALLDAIDVDPLRQSAVITAVRKTFP